MELFDTILDSLIPILVLTHLLLAPYTKVEESFNIQATHDILNYGLPTSNIFEYLHYYYDHFTFPGAVPRTFIGALALAGISKPLILLVGTHRSQFMVRAVLGLFNALALSKYKKRLVDFYGKDTGRWFILLQASQFHTIYYASRTLPNMFAFGLSTLALGMFLPTSHYQELQRVQNRQKLGIFLLVFSGVVFRSEIAVLLVSQLLYLLLHPRISLGEIIPTGLWSAAVSLIFTCTVDSYFWQTPIWPELFGFCYNAIQGKSVNWGVSPSHFYFTNLLPKLLLNPLTTFALIPAAFMISGLKLRTKELMIPSLLFVAIYSLQPHKEARFIIYVVPPLTAAASCSASYIWARRSKSLIYRLSTYILVLSIAGSFMASTGMLLVSSLNYPGGDAISQLNVIIKQTESFEPQNITQEVLVHMDVLSCMTGVTRFLEIPWHVIKEEDLPIINGVKTRVVYDRTEDDAILRRSDWWEQFDYALMEKPELALGKWDVVATIFGYSGFEITRPSDSDSLSEHMNIVYAAENITLGGYWNEDRKHQQNIENLKMSLLLREIGNFGYLHRLKYMVRVATGGWWAGPRMEPKIRILKRLRSGRA